MTTRFRITLGSVALAAGLVCLPACGKKKGTDDGDGGPAGGTGGAAPGSTRESRRASEQNLRQIGLALHAHADTWSFLPAGVADKSGKVGLSWRVQILPFLEQESLYKQFKLNEPWDSDHNKKLIDRMPKQYASAGKAAPPGHTFYRGFGGPQGVFYAANPVAPPGGPLRGRRLIDMMDGTSNTIMVVEAGEAVPWTKPEEIPYDPKGPVPKVGGVFSDVVIVLMGDGSTRSLTQPVDEKLLRALITPNGGEIPEIP